MSKSSFRGAFCGLLALLTGACASATSNLGGTADRGLDYVVPADTFETQAMRHVITLAVLASAASANTPEEEAERAGMLYRLASAVHQTAQLRILALTPCFGNKQENVCTDRSGRLVEFERLQVRLYRNQLSLAADASPDINLGDFTKAIGSGNPLVVATSFVSNFGQFEAITRLATDLLANYRSTILTRAELYTMLDTSKTAFDPTQKKLLDDLVNLTNSKSADLKQYLFLVRELEKSPGFLSKVTVENLTNKDGPALKGIYYGWANIITDSCLTIAKDNNDLKVACTNIRKNLIAMADATDRSALNMRNAQGVPTNASGQRLERPEVRALRL
jgi:hypothetical protein